MFMFLVVTKVTEKLITKYHLLRPLTSNYQCVAIDIPEFYRGQGDPANLVGIVLEITDTGKYKIGTRGGTINTWLERNGFELIKFCKDDVLNNEGSIRESAAVNLLVKIIGVGVLKTG